ncbi:MAG: hypothetical protein NVS1B13_02230 [Flavisolibacter sp.]
MKSIIRRAILPFIRNDKSWKLLRHFAIAGLYMINHREKFQREKNPMLSPVNENKEFDFLFPDKKVLYGPFKGMKYPFFSSICSMLYPKLLGSYEKELQPFIESYCKDQYSEILDIGCAEGYYAIGLALKNPQSKVYAFDTDQNARNLCYEMAKANGVENRIEIKGSCSAEDLARFSFGKKGLIIADCEGYELSLFTRNNINNLKNCDVLIETHDFINIQITTYLYDIFQNTHDITIVRSVDDIEKAKTYLFKESDSMDLATKKLLFQEGRPGTMEWFICAPKS